MRGRKARSNPCNQDVGVLIYNVVREIWRINSFMIASHNNQKKIAVVNDFSGFGRCSIAVALPIISAMKIQCCPVPTSIFSNHTGFDSYFFEDYTDRMKPYIAEWRKLGLHFDGICTGFLGSVEQISIVSEFLRSQFPSVQNLFSLLL